MAASKCVLIVTWSTEQGYQRETLRGVREYAAEQGWNLQVQLGPWRPVPEATRRSLAGVILNLTDDNCYRSFANLPVPMVSYCDRMERSPLSRVTMDNAQAGRLAAEHFLERNIRNLAFCGADRSAHYAAQRQAEFVRACRSRDVRVDSVPQTAIEQNGGRAFREWLDRTPKPVGLLAIDDYTARDVAQRCMEWGFKVPGQVLILGFNNDVFDCEFCQPSLSSVIMPSRAIGYKAAEMLDALMRGRRLAKNEFLIASPGIVERASTRTAAFGCPELDRALRFIRQNAAEPIGVKQVIEHAATTKRTLEQIFADHLGHGPGEELRRARLTLAKFYLTTTNQPVHEVARLSGFGSLTHLGVVMRRYEKQTPSEYRRRHAGVGA